MSKLALQIINDYKNNPNQHNKKLDLGNCGLTELPHELFDLTDLEELVVSNEYWCFEMREWVECKNEGPENKLSHIPKAIGQLQQLKVLILSSKGKKNWFVKDIKPLAKLGQLSELILQFNQIQDISPLAKLKQLTKLNLHANQINDISVIGKLKKLRVLYLGYNQIEDISTLGELKLLTELNLRSTQLKDISVLSKLKQLKRFWAFLNAIKNVDALGKLEQLIELDLGSNQIENIEALAKLKHLTKLDLGSNLISDIAALSQLEQLTRLDLYGNQFEEISALSNLKQLTELNLSFNPIQDIKPLRNLNKLTKLHLQSNKIDNIDILGELKLLTDLDLGSNQIKNTDSLSKLKLLKRLDVRKNKIVDVDHFAKLKQLIGLYLSNNKIINIDALGKLKNLKRLDIHNNYIKNITAIDKLNQLTQLDLYNNPVKDIDTSEKNRNYTASVKEYFNRKAEKTKIKVQLPIKVVLLGNHRTGKSSFSNFFVNNTLKSESSTHILRILNYPRESENELPKAVFFDFGGQDYYHGLYRIYLSDQAVNLIFWRERDKYNQMLQSDSNGLATCNFNLNYWLAQKAFFESNRKETDKAILIKTYIDKNNKIPKPDTEYTYHESFKCCFAPQSEDFIGRDHLKFTLINEIEELAEQNVVEEPKWYINFLKFLYNHKPENPFEPLTFEYILNNHYNRKAENKAEKIKFLEVNLRQLHNSGIILFYDSKQLQSKNNLTNYGLIWTNPSALVEELHRDVFNKSKLLNSENPGITTLKKLGLDIEKDANVFELLKIQKVIFYHEKQKKYIIPNFLKLSTQFDGHYHKLKELLNYQFSLNFKYFIPFGLINELMCFFGENAEDFCRNGIIFKVDKATISIELDVEKLQINIYYFLKDKKQKHNLDRYLFSVILAFYMGVKPVSFKEFGKLTTKKNHEGPGDIDKANEDLNQFLNIIDMQNPHFPKDLLLTVNEKDYVEYVDLVNEGEEIEAHNETGESLERNISITPFSAFMETPISVPKKIFVSYANKDKDLVKSKLILSLKNLKRQDKIKIWDEEKIPAGMEWDLEIKRQLQAADIILLVVSLEFIASDYEWDIELKKAIERHNNKEAIVIPIILSPCDWMGDETPFSKLSAIPTNGKPITTFKNQDEAWMEVLQKIKSVI